MKDNKMTASICPNGLGSGYHVSWTDSYGTTRTDFAEEYRIDNIAKELKQSGYKVKVKR